MLFYTFIYSAIIADIFKSSHFNDLNQLVFIFVIICYIYFTLLQVFVTKFIFCISIVYPVFFSFCFPFLLFIFTFSFCIFICILFFAFRTVFFTVFLLFYFILKEIARFMMYLCVPIFSSVIYANPGRMHAMSKFYTRYLCVMCMCILGIVLYYFWYVYCNEQVLHVLFLGNMYVYVCNMYVCVWNMYLCCLYCTVLSVIYVY